MIKKLGEKLKTNNNETIVKNNNKSNNQTVGFTYHTTQNAITLITLVITIIILLILSGVTLSLIIGKNRIINISEQSTNEYTRQEASEVMNLKITNIQIKSYTETQKLPNLQYLADKLCEDDEIEYVVKKKKEIASLDKIDVSDVTSIFAKIKKYPYEFEIDESLRLASIDGIKLENNVDNNDLISRLDKMELEIKELKNNKILNIREKLTSEDFNPSVIPVGNNQKIEKLASIKLNKSIEEYKYLEFQIDIKSNSDGFGNVKSEIIAVDLLKYNNSDSINWTDGSDFVLSIIWCDKIASIAGYFKNDKELNIGSSMTNHPNWSFFRIKEIYGIK